MWDERVQPGDTIVVWFSCGAASATALSETKRIYGELCNVAAVNNPVQEEDSDNRRFLRDVERWLDLDVQIAVNPKYDHASAEQTWQKRGYMNGVAGAPCTVHLKKEARQHWEKHNRADWLVLGFTADEEKRLRNFRLSERENTLGVLVDGGITKQDCYDYLKMADIEPPRVYAQGYPNANCIGCVKASSPTYWNHVRVQHPGVFEKRAQQSRGLGARLVRVKGQRIFLDELDPKAKGRPMKSMDVECGIFCAEDLPEDKKR